jgi:hypothetical protein
MVDKPLDDPEVLAFLADGKGFGSHRITANQSLHSGRAITMRYEDPHRFCKPVFGFRTAALAPK